VSCAFRSTARGGQPQRRPDPVILAALPPAIVQLVELGDPRRNIPPCASCHRAGAGGPIETPVLAEQQAEYLAQQLRLYASGERRNDVYARMRTIAAQLTAQEIDGLAAYYRAGFR
jgi:cytochrome c553